MQRRRAMAEEMMHRAICDAAAAVLADVGFTALTMERVAEAAGVSKGTLYNYFSGQGCAGAGRDPDDVFPVG